MAEWREHIPAAIEKAERLLGGDEHLLVPPHLGGNDTKLTLVLTKGEVRLVKALEQDHDAHWKEEALSEDYGVVASCDEAECVPCAALREFGEKMGGLDD